MNKIYELHSNKTEFNINFSEINIIFAPNKSCKTLMLTLLYDLFENGDKNTTLNGEQINENSFKCLFIDSNNSPDDILKLTAKSEFKIKLNTILDLPNIDEYLKILDKQLSSLENEINLQNNSNKVYFKLDKFCDIRTFITSNLKLKTEMSSSEKQELLYDSLLKNVSPRSIVFIDDFDKGLNEESAINFIKQLNRDNKIYFLTTCNPQTFKYCFTHHSAFTVKNKEILSVNKLVEDFFKVKDDLTKEEYLLDSLYDQSQFVTNYLKSLSFISVYSIGRLLTNINTLVSNIEVSEFVCIPFTSDAEEELLNYLKSIIITQ